MTQRTPPADIDRFAYDLDMIRMGGREDVTLRRILITATNHGTDAGIHDDEDRAEEFSETCWMYKKVVETDSPFVVSVAEAKKLFDACMSTWEYADDNHYGDPAEDIEEDRVFGQCGKFMLQCLAHPWTWLALKDDGSDGFTKL